MILKSLKTYFNEALLGYYPDTEINSFFYILTNAILGMKRIDVSLKFEEHIKDETYNAFQSATECLQKYEPIQYIIGDTEFYGLNFSVNSSVLIPRPETEELVDWIIKENQSKASISILDIGTGSGCIAVSLAKHIPNAKVYALDVSKEALKIAKQNAKENQVDIMFVETDVLKLNQESVVKIRDFPFGNDVFNKSHVKFDIIVSNPPYVRELEKELMNANVLKHEPHLALFVEDDDALLFYRKIAQLSKRLLANKGQLYFEINEYLGKDVKMLLEKEGFKNIELKQDIFKKDRMIKAIQ